jgi:hypothetical protein
MCFIVVFTIFCEQCVAAMKRWVEYFNPLLQPCLDKVIAELMILGATAFMILLTNEGTNYSLSNGTLVPTSWYHTLHWVDTTIFIFAVVFVGAACFVLFLCGCLTNWLAEVDAKDTAVVFDKAWRLDVRAHAANTHLTMHLTDSSALALPAAAVDRLLSDADADPLGSSGASLGLVERTNLHEVQQRLRGFLCGAEAECSVALDSSSRSYVSRALASLVEFNVLACHLEEEAEGGLPSRGGAISGVVVVTKLPAEQWDFSRHHARSSATLSRCSRLNVTGCVIGCVGGWWGRVCVRKNLQYLLVKRHFQQRFFGTTGESLNRVRSQQLREPLAKRTP